MAHCTNENYRPRKYGFGGGLAVGSLVGGYLGYKIGRAVGTRKGGTFDTEKKIGRGIKKTFSKKKKFSDGGRVETISELYNDIEFSNYPYARDMVAYFIFGDRDDNLIANAIKGKYTRELADESALSEIMLRYEYNWQDNMQELDVETTNELGDLMDYYSEGGEIEDGYKLYDAILEGYEGGEEFALNYARELDWGSSEYQMVDSLPTYKRYINTINGIDVYYDYGADYYFFVDSDESFAKGGSTYARGGRSRKYYNNDPRLIYAKYDTICSETGEPIKKGEQCVYYPSSKSCFSMNSKQAKEFRDYMSDLEMGYNYAKGGSTQIMLGNKLNKNYPEFTPTIQYAGDTLTLFTVFKDEDKNWSSEAQKMIDNEKRRGRRAKVIHKGGNHALYLKAYFEKGGSTYSKGGEVFAIYNSDSKEIVSRGLTSDMVDDLMYRQNKIKNKSLKVIKDVSEEEISIQKDGSIKLKKGITPKYLGSTYYNVGGAVNNYDWSSKPIELSISDWKNKVGYPRYHNFNNKKYHLAYNFDSKAKLNQFIKDSGTKDSITQPIKYTDGQGVGLPKYFLYVAEMGSTYAEGGEVMYLLKNYGYKGNRGDEIIVDRLDKKLGVYFGSPKDKSKMKDFQKKEIFEYEISDVSSITPNPTSKSGFTYYNGGGINDFGIGDKVMYDSYKYGTREGKILREIDDNHFEIGSDFGVSMVHKDKIIGYAPKRMFGLFEQGGNIDDIVAG